MLSFRGDSGVEARRVLRAVWKQERLAEAAHRTRPRTGGMRERVGAGGKELRHKCALRKLRPSVSCQIRGCLRSRRKSTCAPQSCPSRLSGKRCPAAGRRVWRWILQLPHGPRAPVGQGNDRNLSSAPSKQPVGTGEKRAENRAARLGLTMCFLAKTLISGFGKALVIGSCLRRPPPGGLIPMGILGFHETCLWGGNSSSRGGEAPRPCAPRERPRILDGKERGPGRFPFLGLLSRAGI